jgi:hypothetical protein
MDILWNSYLTRAFQWFALKKAAGARLYRPVKVLPAYHLYGIIGAIQTFILNTKFTANQG